MKNNAKSKTRVVETVPAIGDMAIGEFVYDVTNGKLVLKTIAGFVYFTKD